MVDAENWKRFQLSYQLLYTIFDQNGRAKRGKTKDVNLTQSYGITSSMSSKGNSYDNAMAENFFSILKTECIYRHKPKTLQKADDLIDRYIHFYNYERIQTKTGVAPLALRHSA